MVTNENKRRFRAAVRAVNTGRKAYSAQRYLRRLWVWVLIILAAVVVVAASLFGGDDDDDDDDDFGMGYSVVQLG